jgi:DNA-binding Lrp family transcriptional regulator
MTAEQMAESVSLSASAIQRRLQRLRKHGVILGATAILDPAKIGRPSFFVVSLEVERERPELLSQLRSWLNAQDEVQHAFYATGTADFVLLLTAPNPESYEEFMTGLMSSNPNVRRFSTNVVLSVVKRSLLIPVPEAEVERQNL